MSAFVVGHDHIDAMLTRAVKVPTHGPCNSGRPVSWYRQDPEVTPYVELEGLSIQRCTSNEELTVIGRMLLAENELSVAARYPNDAIDDLPGHINERIEGYTFRRVRDESLTPVVALSLLACYEYQSCEHREWDSSQAYRFCQGYRLAMIAWLPGYSDAPWEYRREEVVA